jgi:NAD(P)-dependent dehydrogenase (short-subunit alcohol dehydrogenase family)
MLEVNLVAPFVISRAFAEHVARSERKVIAFITSRMGSTGLNNTGRSYAYRSSNSALNMVMKSLAIDLGPPRSACSAFTPAKSRCKATRVEHIRKHRAYAGGHRSFRPAPDCIFYDYNGQILPW